MFSVTYLESKTRFGALSALNAVKFAVKFIDRDPVQLLHDPRVTRTEVNKARMISRRSALADDFRTFVGSNYAVLSAEIPSALFLAT